MIRNKKIRALIIGILLAICLTLLPVSLTMLSDGQLTADASGYTQIIADRTDSSYKAYSGATTTSGLKKNLVVKGITDGGSEVTLLDDEYEVTIGEGAEVSEGGIITKSGDNDSFGVVVRCGALFSDIVIPFAEGAPDLTGTLSFELKGSLTDDYTADTVYKLLTVKAGEKVLSPDLYTVEMADIYNSSSAAVTVKAGSGTATKNVPVSRARLLSVELRVKSEYKLGSDNRYKDSENNDVFVQGAHQENVFGRLEIVAVFANGKRQLQPEFNTQNELSGIMSTGETVRTTLPTSMGPVADFTVTVTRDGSVCTSNNLNILFSAAAVIKIEVNQAALNEWNAHNAAAGSTTEGARVLYPYTNLKPEEMKGDDGKSVFTLKRNDGGTDADLSQLQFEDSLVAQTTDVLYNKSVKVALKANSDVSVSVEIENINNKTPDGLEISGKFDTQIKHHEVNLEGLVLTFKYKLNNFVTMSADAALTDYKEYVTAVAMNINNPSATSDKILTDSNYASVTIAYNGLTAQKADAITTVNDRIALPMTDVSVITYTDGCKKTFEGFAADIMSLRVYNSESCSEEVPSDAYERKGSDLFFKSGGTYYVKIALNDGEINGFPSEEYNFYYEGGTTPTGITMASDRRSAVYVIQINRGTLAINLSLPEDTEFRYGGNAALSFTATGTSNGKTTELGALGVEYKLKFVKEGEAFDYNALTYESCTNPEKLSAGKYTVYAVTKETAAYLAGKVRENKGVIIDILPAVIDNEEATAVQTYARKAYQLSDFISYSGFKYSETAADVLETVGAGELKLAGEYSVTVSLKSENYVWKDGTTDNKTIKLTIAKKEFTGFGIAFNPNTFHYGNVSLNPTVNGAEVAYFSVGTQPYIGSQPLTDPNSLEVGSYTVSYKVTANYQPGENAENSFVLPSAEANITIEAARINKLEFDASFGDYKKDGYTKTVGGWNDNLAAGSAAQPAHEGIAFSCEYTPFTGSAASDYNPKVDNTSAQITFTEAGAYVVSFSLKNINYVWADGSEEALMFSFTITRAGVGLPSLPQSVTYTGSAHNISVSGYSAELFSYTVEGVTLAAQGITVVPTGGSFAVTYAGDYSLTFTLKDKNNYGWGEDKSPDDYTATYTVLQADLSVKWDKINQDFEDDKAEQKISANATVSGTYDDSRLKINKFKIYSDAACTNEIAAVTEAGTYYLKVTDFGLADGITDFDKNNYRLNYDNKTAQLIIEYTVLAQSLKLPVLNGSVGNTVTVVYRGTEYKITEFFDNDEKDYQLGSDKYGRLSISYSDVCLSKGSYTVTVAPAGNYTWLDNTSAEITYTIVIKPREISFTWGETVFEFDGTAKTPTATPTGLADTDSQLVSVVIGITQTNAGEYPISFADFSLVGVPADNYVLVEAEIYKQLIIKRKRLDKPAANNSETLTFNEAQQALRFDNIPDAPALNVTVTGDGGSYANGEFKFTYAGDYTITFTLTSNNYCWDEEHVQMFGNVGLDYTYSLTVNRKEITAPALKELRAVAHGEVSKDLFTNKLEPAVNVIYNFGTYSGGIYTQTEISEFELGVYYIKLTLAPGAFASSNYKWIENTDDSKQQGQAWGYLINAGGVYGKIENNTELYLCFVVTQTQVEISFSFKDYTFGDNGWGDGGVEPEKKLTGDSFTLENIGEASSQLISYDGAMPSDAKYSIAVVFTGEGLVLVNGLPWNAGKYKAKISVSFEKGSTYQNFTAEIDFTVSPRPVIIAWDGDEEAVYNGDVQTRTPSLTNVRYSTASHDSVEVPVLGLNNNAIKDVLYQNNSVKPYELSVTSVGSGNYTLVNGQNIQTTFKITPAPVTIEAKDLKHVYGDSTDYLDTVATEYFKVTAGTLYSSDEGCIRFVITNAPADGLPSVDGSYTVRPELKEVYGNYTLTPVDGSFTVLRREIEVTYNSDGVKGHVYGEELLLNSDSNFTAVNTNGSGSVFGKDKTAADVFKLFLGNDGSVRVDDGDTKAAAADYIIKLDNIDAINYNVSFTEVDYTITPASITNVRFEGYVGEYDGFAHVGIINNSAATVNGQSVVWQIAEENSEEYFEINSDNGKVTNVSDSGRYKLKLTAPNHEPYLHVGTFEISISKATLTVSVSMSIYYGEEGPDKHGEGEAWYKQSLECLIERNGIYKVSGFKNADEALFYDSSLSLEGEFGYGYAADVYTKGDKVGSYALEFLPQTLVSENYLFVGAAGVLTVNRLPVTVKLQSLTAVYDSADAPAVDTAIAEITTAALSGYGSGVVAIFEETSKILTLSTDALNSVTEGIKTNKVGRYPITEGSRSDNYTITYSYQTGSQATYSITKAANALNGAYKLFVSAADYGEAEVIALNAWVYGEYTLLQTDGYNPEGDQKANEAEFLYNEHSMGITYRLYKKGESELLLRTASSLAALLDGGLSAGSYRVSIYFPAGDNYDEVNASRCFGIGKRALTVTADNLTVIYGEAAPEYTYSVAGYATVGGELQNIDVFSEMPSFVCDYLIGSNAGDYNIAYSAGSTELENYTVSYNGATLTVSKREVTVKIDCKQSSYTFYNDNNLPQTLTYRVEEGSFYNNEEVLALKTTAHDGTTTRDIGDYPIYAVFTNAGFANNYTITVSNSGKELYVGGESLEEELLANANAGVYTITPARLTVTVNTTPKSSTTADGSAEGDLQQNTTSVYDGLYKGYVLDRAPTLAAFYAVYWEADKDESTAAKTMFKDVGSYYCRFVSENKNYEWSAGDIRFEITGKQLTIRPMLYNSVTGEYESSFNLRQTYGKDFLFKFFVDGVVGDEAAEIISSVLSVKTGDSYFVNNGAFNPFGKLALAAGDGKNEYTLSLVNVGDYTVKMQLASSEENYSLAPYEFKFTVDRAEFKMVADSTFVQYGTPLSYDGAFIPQYGVSGVDKNGKQMLADGKGIEELYELFRFAGFTLTDETLAVIAAENAKGGTYFDISGLRFVVADYSAASTPAGRSCFITVATGSVHSYNYKPVSEREAGSQLDVIQRRITVTVNGYTSAADTFAQAEYTGGSLSPEYGDTSDNKSRYFVPEENVSGAMWYGATADGGKFVAVTNTELTVSNAVNVRAEGYPIYVRQNGSSNYLVTFKNKNGVILNGYTDEQELPVFMITQRSLTVSVASSAASADSFNVIYGNTTDGLYKVIYDGLVDKDGGNGSTPVDGYNVSADLVTDNIRFTEVKSGGTAAYGPWYSHAGEVYRVSVDGISFVNYSVTFKSANMTVVPRKIVVETFDRVYTEMEENGVKIYNEGRFGIEHIAPIRFSDVDGNHNNAGSYSQYLENSAYINAGTTSSDTLFTLEYSTDGASWSRTAPNTAGKYLLRITLSGGRDFVIDTANNGGTAAGEPLTEASAVFDYEVQRKELAIGFEDKPSDYYEWNSEEDLGVKHISILDFVNDIMKADYVQRDNVDLELASAAQAGRGGYYTVGAGGLGLSVYPDGVGLYTAIITIKNTALENYVWVSGGSNVSITFSIASDILRILSLDIADWAYLEYDEEANRVHIEYDQPIKDLVFSYQYWEYNGEIPEGVRPHTMLLTLDGFTGDRAFKSSLPVNAGVYILKAQYTGGLFTTSIAYCIFEITPKEIAAPEFNTDGTEANVSYDANPHSAVIDYNAAAIDYTYAHGENGDGVAVRSGNTLTVTATNAAAYTLSFRLTDTRNYIWADGVPADKNGAVRLEWSIAKATDNEVTVDEATAEYGDGFETSASSKYAGEIVYYYAVRGSEQKPASGAEWLGVRPVYAGKYWIKAVCGETPNFESSEGYGRLTITRATLTATPYGSMTYGDGFANADKAIEYTGWKGAVHSVDESVVFTIAGYGGGALLEVSADGYVLIAEGEITVDEQYDEDNVFGVVIDNYIIEIAEGVFTVNRKSVEVTIGDLTVTYGEDFNAGGVKLTEQSLGQLVGADRDDALAALNINPFVVGEKTDGYYSASSYRIESEGHRDSRNYEVTVRSGLFTVEKLEVYISVEAGGGEYGSVTGASVIDILTENGEDVKEKFGNLAPAFGFLYSGTANDGTVISNSAEIPFNAGNYTAVARITNFVGNYTLLTDAGNPSVTFIVARRAIAEDEITVEELKFDNTDQSPVITDNKYSDLYTAADVTCREVGSYTVTLTLVDEYNYRWSSVEGSAYQLPFSMGRGDNEFITEVVINGWSYGDSPNLPEAETAFGESSSYIYTYSTAADGEYTVTVPTAAGTYWVKITVPQSDNYNEKTSEPVSFTISKRAIKAPSLETVAEGANANTVYTGLRLQSVVKNFDPLLMRVIYEGDMSSAGTLAVYAVNAGEYKVYLALNDADNYMWEEGTELSEGNAVLIWKIARKRLEKPTMNTELYMVNGGTLTFIPNGFDEETMSISGNTTSYGGAFEVTVSIKDKVNYEWADGTAEDIAFDWIVVGWDTVFVIVVSVLGVVGGIAAVAIGVQYGLHKRKKRVAAAAQASAAAVGEVTAPPEQQPAAEEEPSFNKPAEQAAADGNEKGEGNE